MINGKSILVIIPARGGSKGLPGKNIKKMCGKPLISWTIENALNSQYVDKVIVSSDDEEIIKISNTYGAETPFVRPDDLATDNATSFPVIKHAIEFLHDNYENQYDIIIMMEPTSPLREPNDIDVMLEKFNADYDAADSIISIGLVAEHPSIIKKIDGNLLKPFVDNLPMTMRRQDQSPAYFPYGVAYIAKRDALLKEKTFYTIKCLHHTIKRYQCYEIDDIYDFITTENIMRYEWKLN